LITTALLNETFITSTTIKRGDIPPLFQINIETTISTELTNTFVSDDATGYEDFDRVKVINC